jgi:hypothetical protein
MQAKTNEDLFNIGNWHPESEMHQLLLNKMQIEDDLKKNIRGRSFKYGVAFDPQQNARAIAQAQRKSSEFKRNTLDPIVNTLRSPNYTSVLNNQSQQQIEDGYRQGFIDKKTRDNLVNQFSSKLMEARKTQGPKTVSGRQAGLDPEQVTKQRSQTRLGLEQELRKESFKRGQTPDWLTEGLAGAKAVTGTALGAAATLSSLGPTAAAKGASGKTWQELLNEDINKKAKEGAEIDPFTEAFAGSSSGALQAVASPAVIGGNIGNKTSQFVGGLGKSEDEAKLQADEKQRVYDELGINQWYTDLTGDPQNLERQKARITAFNVTTQAPLAMANLAGMQIVGNAVAKALMPVVQNSLQLNLARGAGMLLPTAVGAVGVGTNNQLLQDVANPLEAAQREGMAPGEYQLRQEINQDEDMQNQQLAMTMGMFGLGAPSLYKDAGQMFRLSKQLGKAGVFGRIAKINPASVEGRNLLNEYTRLQGEIIPDVAFGLTNIFDPVARTIGSKFNEKVQAPTAKEWATTALLTAVAVRPHKGLQPFFANNLNRSTDIKGQAKFAAMDAIDNASFHALGVNSRYEALRGGRAANSQDLQRVTSMVYEMAAQEFQQQDRSAPTIKSLDQIFFEILNGKSTNSVTADDAIKQMRVRGDNASLPFDSPLHQMQVNKNLFPIDPAFRKKAVAQLARQLEPAIALEYDMMQRGAKFAGEEAAIEQQPDKKFYAIKIGEQDGQPEYIVYNKRFSDATLHRGEAGLEDVRIIDPINQDKIGANARIERLTNVMRSLKSEFSPRNNMWIRNGVSKAIGVIRPDGTIVIKESKGTSGRTGERVTDVTYTYASFEDVQKDLSGIPGTQGLLNALNEVYTRTGMRRDVANKEPVLDIGDSENFPSRIQFSTTEQVNGRLVDTIGLQTPIGLYQLPDGGVALGRITESGNQKLAPLTEADVAQTPEIQTRTVLSQAESFVKNGKGYIDADVHNLGTRSRVEMPTEIQGVVREILESDAPDAVKAQQIMSVLIDEISGNRLTGDKALRLDPETGRYVNDVELKAGDRVLFASDETNPNDVTEGVVVKADNGMATVKDITDPTGAAYTLSADRFILSDKNINRESLRAQFDEYSAGANKNPLRPVEMTVSDEEAIARLLTATETVDRKQEIANASPEKIFDVLYDAIVNSRATVEGIQLGLIEWATRNTPEGVYDVMAQVMNEIMAPGKEVPIAKFRKATEIFSNRGFNQTLYGVHAIWASVAAINGTRFAAAPRTISQKAGMLQIARRMNMLMMRAETMGDEDLFKAAVRSLDADIANLSKAKIIEFAQNLRGIAPHVFYYMQDLWHVAKISGSNHAAQATLGRAISAAQDAGIRSLVRGDSILPDSVLDFWGSESKFDKAVKDIRELITSTREVEVEGQTQKYKMSDVVYARLRNAGLEFLYHMANDTTRTAVRRGLRTNRLEAINFQNEAMSYMYDTFLPQVVVDQINNKISSGDFMRDAEGKTEQTNNISYAPELRAFHDQIISAIEENPNLSSEQKSDAIGKITSVVQELDMLLPSDIEALSEYDSDGPRDARLRKNIVVNGEVVAEDQPANLKALSAERHYDKSLSNLVKESGMTLSEAQQRKHIALFETFAKQANQLFGLDRSFTNLKSRIDQSPRVRDVRARIDRLQRDNPDDIDAKRALYAERDRLVSEEFNSIFKLTTTTLQMLRSMQPETQLIGESDAAVIRTEVFGADISGFKETTPLGEAIDDFLSRIVDLRRRIISTDDIQVVSNEFERDGGITEAESEAAATLGEGRTSPDEDVAFWNGELRKVEQQLADARRDGGNIDELVVQREALQKQLKDAQDATERKNTPLDTLYTRLDSAGVKLKSELQKLNPSSISIEDMLSLHQMYMSLARSNSVVTNEIAGSLTTDSSVRNILATDEIRRLRSGMAEAEAFASASMTDVIELQLGSLSPEVFAEKYKISPEVAKSIATIDALNPSNRSEPVNVTDDDMLGVSVENMDPSIRGFVSDAPQIAAEVISSPDSFGGMITIEKPEDQSIVAYTAQNLAGMRVLMRTMLARNFKYADVEAALTSLEQNQTAIKKAISDSYADPTYMAEKLKKANGKFINLLMDDDTATYVRKFTRMALRKLQTDVLPRANRTLKTAVEAAIFELENMPEVATFTGKTVEKYYDNLRQRLNDIIAISNPEEKAALIDSVINMLNPETNNALVDTPLSAQIGSSYDIRLESDPAFTARRLLSTLNTKGIQFKSGNDDASAYSATSNDPVVNHAQIRLAHLPLRMSDVPIDTAAQLVSLYDDVLNNQLPPLDSATEREKPIIEAITRARDAYNDYAMGETGDSRRSAETKQQMERAAIQQLADNLANLYDIHANSFAVDHLEVKINSNSNEFKSDIAEAMRVLNINEQSIRRLMEPTTLATRFLSDLDPAQKTYIMSYLTAKYKKQYYTSHNKIYLVNDEILETANAKATLFVDKRDVYGFTQTLQTNQKKALGSLLYIGSNGNSKYRSTLTLVHEMFHPLFTGMDDVTQVAFMDQLATKGGLAVDALNEVLAPARKENRMLRDAIPTKIEEIQKVLDKRNNAELALALQVRVAKESSTLPLNEALAPLKGLTFNGQDLSEGWISHGHEKFVTSMMNFISDYTVPISKNAAASVDMATLEVFQQMRSTLRYVMRQISNKRPLDIIKDVSGTPHAAWYSRVPIQKYEFTRVHNPKQFTLNALNPRSGFTRSIEFAQLRKDDYLRINIPNRPEARSAVMSPTQLITGLEDSLTLNTIGDFAGSRFRFGFKHDGQIGDAVGATWLPFENPELRTYLVQNPDLLSTVEVFPENGRNDTNVISPDSMPSRSFSGQVKEMVIKTRFRTFDEAITAGFEPVFFDKDNIWVRGEADEDGWFKPRVRVQSDNPRVLDYAVAGQHEYAYIVEAPAVARVGGPTRAQKNFPTQFRFLVGEGALRPDAQSQYDPILVGYTQEFDPKFSALVYDLTRKLGRVVYNTTGNVRWKKQLELQGKLLTGDAKSFTLRTQTPMGEALDTYFKSTEYKAIKASRTSMQPLVLDGAAQFEAVVSKMLLNEFSVEIDGEQVLTEEGERFIQSLNDEISNVLAPYIAEQMLFRHDTADTYQTTSMTIEPNSVEMDAMFTVFKSMLGDEGDVDVLRNKLADAYVALNTRGDVRVSPNIRIDRALGLAGIPDSVTLEDGSEYHVRDMMLQVLRNDRLSLSNSDLTSVYTSYDNLWNNVLLPFIETGKIDAPYELNSAKPTMAMYALDSLMNAAYGNSVESKRLFLQRLTADTNVNNYGDIVYDVEERERYRAAVQAKNSAFSEFLAVAHTLDAQSRELGRALYAWKDWSLLDGQESFRGATGNTTSVIIQSPDGATFRVNLNNPRNFVESVARDVSTGAYIDASPFSQMFALYNPNRQVALRSTTNEPTPYALRDLNLSPEERNALNSSGSIDIVRPFGIDNVTHDEDGNQLTPNLRIFRINKTGKSMNNRGTQFGDPYEKINVSELQHSYKSGYITGENQDVWVNNQRLLQQPVNDLLRRAFLSNPSLEQTAKDSVGNTAVVPREVHIAKLLVSRALIDDTGQVPNAWKRKNATDTLARQRLLEGDKEASIADAMENPRVEHNRTKTWMSDGVEEGHYDNQEMTAEEMAYFKMPFDLSPEQAQDPALRSQYNQTASTRALEKALSVPQPQRVIIKRESDPSVTKVGVTAKDRDIYVSIPDADYDYVSRTMFSASGPTGTPTPHPGTVGVPKGGIASIPFLNNPFTKRGAVTALGIYHELTSGAKALILSGDFARVMLQNYRLTAMNPKNFAAQFWGLSAFLPNAWAPGAKVFGTPTTGAGKFLNFALGHRPDLAWGDMQYHAKMFNYLNKYGTKGNVIGYGIPGVHKRQVNQTYGWNDLAEYGLKTTYGDWFRNYEAAKLIDPTIDPFEMPIATTQAENIGEGVLARRIPFVNMWERAGALSTDILRVKSFLEFSAYVDQSYDYSYDYQRDQAKRDYAAFLNVVTGHPTGNNLMMSDNQNLFNQTLRTIYTSPNWFNSLMMQTYLPSLAKMYVAEGVNYVSRAATSKMDIYGVGFDVIDTAADQKWFRSLRSKDVLKQHGLTFFNSFVQAGIIGSVLQLMGLYAERRQLHEINDSKYIDFLDWRKINSPVLNDQGVDLAANLRIDQQKWWDPTNPDFGVVRAANTLQWQLPPIFTLYKRLFLAPYIQATNEPNASTEQKAMKYASELYKSNIEGRFGPPIQGIKQLASGRTYLEEAALGKAPGLKTWVDTERKIVRYKELMNDAKQSGNNALADKYNAEIKKLSPAIYNPSYPLIKALTRFFPNGISRYALSMLTNLQVQTALKDMEELGYSQHAIPIQGDNNPDLVQYQFPAFTRIFGQEGRMGDYYTNDLITKEERAGMSGKQFEFLTKKYKYNYPNASAVVKKFGLSALLLGIPESGGYGKDPAWGSDNIRGIPDAAVLRESTINLDYLNKIKERQPGPKFTVPSDFITGRMVD